MSRGGLSALGLSALGLAIACTRPVGPLEPPGAPGNEAATHAPAATQAPAATHAPASAHAPATTHAPASAHAPATTHAPAATHVQVLDREDPSSPAEGVLAPAPATTAGTVTDTVALFGLELEILDTGAACVLRHGQATPVSLALAPKPPCHFLRRGGAVQRESYPRVGVDAVVVVAGTPAGEAARRAWNLAPGQICGEQTQGILVRAGRLSATRSVHSGGIACRDQGVDEKELYAFAHDG